MVCLGFLNRVEPYTNSFLQVNSKLDDPNRTLHSIEKQWRIINQDKQSNSELTPEFFYLPEIFKNQ